MTHSTEKKVYTILSKGTAMNIDYMYNIDKYNRKHFYRIQLCVKVMCYMCMYVYVCMYVVHYVAWSCSTGSLYCLLPHDESCLSSMQWMLVLLF